MKDQLTQCPDCGAQLIVNIRGHRQFTCGREDVFTLAPSGVPAVIAKLKPCHTSEIAAQMSASHD